MGDSANVPKGKVEIQGNGIVCDTYGLNLNKMCQLGPGILPIQLNDVDPKDVSSDASKAAILKRFQQKGASALLYYGNGKWHLIVHKPNKAWVMEDDIKKELFSREEYYESLELNVIRMKKRVFDGDTVVFYITMNDQATMVRVAVNKENKQKYEKNKSESEQTEKKGLKGLSLTGEENAKRCKEMDEKHASLRRDHQMKRQREKKEAEEVEKARETKRQKKEKMRRNQARRDVKIGMTFNYLRRDALKEFGFPEITTENWLPKLNE